MKINNPTPVRIWIGKRKKSRKGKIVLALGIFFSAGAAIFLLFKLMKKI